MANKTAVFACGGTSYLACDLFSAEGREWTRKNGREYKFSALLSVQVRFNGLAGLWYIVYDEDTKEVSGEGITTHEDFI